MLGSYIVWTGVSFASGCRLKNDCRSIAGTIHLVTAVITYSPTVSFKFYYFCNQNLILRSLSWVKESHTVLPGNHTKNSEDFICAYSKWKTFLLEPSPLSMEICSNVIGLQFFFFISSKIDFRNTWWSYEVSILHFL